MTFPIGFDNEKYLEEQTAAILKRMSRFDNKLYLEFGGKLLHDFHASRVLPGFDPNVKIELLQRLKGKADIVLCIFAGDIERKKVRADFGITYDADALKQIDDLKDRGLDISAVVITRFENQPSAIMFQSKLERRGIRVYRHYPIRDYPSDVDLIISEEGYGKNEYIETEHPLVVVTGPGPCSGKLSTCLSQLYQDNVRGMESGYAKFETFPIWNIPLKHPVNIAYEAATADLRDYNEIDPFHLEAYNEKAVNYNRDVAIFPVLKRMLDRITGKSVYESPTDMGVNCAGFGITQDEVTQEAAKQEIIRRYFRYRYEYAMGLADQDTVNHSEMIMKQLDLKEEDRDVVMPARRCVQENIREKKGSHGIVCGAAIKLPDGTVITGKNSPLMHAATGLVFNAVKHLAEVPDRIHLLSPAIIESVSNMKQTVLGKKEASLDLEESLVALSISATTNPTAQLAMERLADLRGCEVHLTHIPTPGDEAGLRRLGVRLTCDPNFATKNLLMQ